MVLFIYKVRNTENLKGEIFMTFWFYLAIVFVCGMACHRVIDAIDHPIENFRDFLRVFGRVLEIFALGFIFRFFYL